MELTLKYIFEENKIDAEYKDGTLYITVPKKIENKNKKYIEIK